MSSRYLCCLLTASLLAFAGCSRPNGAAAASKDPRPVATATTTGARPAACTLMSAREMSGLLGANVDAQGENNGSTCIYRRESPDGVFVQLEVGWGSGEAAMVGTRMLGRFEPGMREAGIIDPASGIGDQATTIGPVLMVRTGEDLVTLTFQGVADPPATARRIIEIVRPRMGASAASNGHSTDGSTAGPSDAVPSGSKDAIASLVGGLVGAATREHAAAPEPPADLATAFRMPPATDAVCAAGGVGAAAEIAAESVALVPLVTGLTMADTWRRDANDHDNECLVQVTAIDADSVSASMSCPRVKGRKEPAIGRRRVCRADLRDGRFYLEGYSSSSPEVVGGATMITLSRRQLEELKGSGSTWIRYFQLVWSNEKQVDLPGDDRYGQIRKVSTGARTLNVNGEQKALPVIHAEGTLARADGSFPVKLTLTVIDDARFPLVLDFEFPEQSFAIHRRKVTYPSAGRMEQQLVSEKRVDVYGIYFDTASATLRPESEPVLGEIAAVMREHKDWRLRIAGHTDSIGTAESNLDLSRRRAENVKAALVERYGLSADRFTTGGHGESVPRDSNDTLEGRARNRRVELVRQ